MTVQELEEMKNVDIRKVDKGVLKDIRQIEVSQSLPLAERVKEFVEQIGNPYCFRVGSVAVKVAFTKDGGSFEERFRKMLKGLK